MATALLVLSGPAGVLELVKAAPAAMPSIFEATVPWAVEPRRSQGVVCVLRFVRGRLSQSVTAALLRTSEKKEKLMLSSVVNKLVSSAGGQFVMVKELPLRALNCATGPRFTT